MDDERKVSLATLARGAAIERFDDELQRTLDNMLDANTDLSTREITLKVKLKPNESRDACAVQVGCSAKLGSPKAVGTLLYIGKTRNGAVALEHDPKQMEMEMNAASSADEKNANLHHIRAQG